MADNSRENTTPIDEVIDDANRRMLLADTPANFRTCAGTPDMGNIDLTAAVLADLRLDRPHDTDKRVCVFIEGVPLCIVCAVQAEGRPAHVVVSGAEYVAVAPRVYLRREAVAKGVDEYMAALNAMTGLH
jgi:hypothetical protein